MKQYKVSNGIYEVHREFIGTQTFKSVLEEHLHQIIPHVAQLTSPSGIVYNCRGDVEGQRRIK